MTEEEFYQKIPAWIGLERSTWNHVTLFAYFCHKYMEKTGVRFRMVRSKSGPTSTKETRDFAKIISYFSPDDYDALGESEKSQKKVFAVIKTYNYINWMFDYKFRNSSGVSGTQLFLAPSIINEFERMYASHLAKTKLQSSVEEFLTWLHNNMPNVRDRFQLESKEEIALFMKYADGLKAKDQDINLIVNKITEMKLL